MIVSNYARDLLYISRVQTETKKTIKKSLRHCDFNKSVVVVFALLHDSVIRFLLTL
jgi:hypothetical protein